MKKKSKGGKVDGELRWPRYIETFAVEDKWRRLIWVRWLCSQVMDAGGGRVPSGMPRALLTMLPRPSSLGQTNRAQSRCTTQCNADKRAQHNTVLAKQAWRMVSRGLAHDCYATVVRWWRLAESAVANAGLITFATQGESAGRSSSWRTDQ